MAGSITRKRIGALAASAAIAVAGVGATGCGDDELNDASQAIDQGVSDATDAADEAAENADEAAENAADDVTDAADDALNDDSDQTGGG